MSPLSCANCGHKNELDAAFCSACGTGLSRKVFSQSPAAASPESPERVASQSILAPVLVNETAAPHRSLLPAIIGVAALCVVLCVTLAYLMFFAPLSTSAYKSSAARNMAASLLLYQDFAKTSQSVTVSSDGALVPAEISTAISRLAQLQRDVEALEQQTSKLRTPAEFKETQRLLMGWLGALSEMLGREHASLLALNQGSTGTDLSAALRAQFNPSDPAVQKLDKAITDAVPIAEGLGVDSGVIDKTIRGSSVSMEPMPDDEKDNAGTAAKAAASAAGQTTAQKAGIPGFITLPPGKMLASTTYDQSSPVNGAPTEHSIALFAPSGSLDQAYDFYNSIRSSGKWVISKDVDAPSIGVREFMFYSWDPEHQTGLNSGDTQFSAVVYKPGSGPKLAREWAAVSAKNVSDFGPTFVAFCASPSGLAAQRGPIVLISAIRAK